MNKTPSPEYLDRRSRKFQAALVSGEVGAAEATDFQAVLTHESDCPVYRGGVSLFGGQGKVWPTADSVECPCDFEFRIQFTTFRP